MDVNEVLSQLSVRQGLRSDRYLVGRAELLRSLVGCYEGRQRSFAWLYGARRIGKSSVALSLLRRAADNGTRGIYVDAGGVVDFHGLVDRIASKFGMLASAPPRELNNAANVLEQVVRTAAQQPLFLVIDEVDSLAPNLRIEEQALLRRLAHEDLPFSCLFASRCTPGALVEEVPEVSSRLLGICIQRRVPPLSRSDIDDLCERVSKDLGREIPASVPQHIWDEFGGLSVAVTAILHAVSVRLIERGSFEEWEIDDLAKSELSSSLHQDLHGFWWDLDPESRIGLVAETPTARQERRLGEDGMMYRGKPVRPRSIVEEGRQLGITRALSTESGNALSRVEDLFSLVFAINDRLKLKTLNEAFRITNDTIKFYVLTRKTCSENDLRDAIDYLYKVFYEGARDRKGSQPYLLPAPLDELYKSARVIGDIANVRNFLFHSSGSATDSERPNKYYREAGDIFEARLGTDNRDLSSEDNRKNFRQSLIDDLNQLLARIHLELDTVNPSKT